MTKISKAEFETLPESLKTKFKGEGESYLLIEEDVDGLKKSKADILKEKKELEIELEALAKFKADHEKSLSQAEEEKLKEAGEFKQLEEKLRAKIAELEQVHAAEIAEDHGIIKLAHLKNLSIEKGMLPDRVKYALPELESKFDLVKEGKEFSLKYKDGIGDAKEIDGVFEGLKSTSSFLFAATGASGGGAAGSNGAGGGETSTMTGQQKLATFYEQTTSPTK